MKKDENKANVSQRWLNEASRQIELHQAVIGFLGKDLFECEDQELIRFFRRGIDLHLFAQDDIVHSFNTPKMTKEAWIRGMSQNIDLDLDEEQTTSATVQTIIALVQRIKRRLMIGLSDMSLSDVQIRMYRQHYITLSTFYSSDKIIALS